MRVVELGWGGGWGGGQGDRAERKARDVREHLHAAPV